MGIVGVGVGDGVGVAVGEPVGGLVGDPVGLPVGDTLGLEVALALGVGAGGANTSRQVRSHVRCAVVNGRGSASRAMQASRIRA